jgi:hypothetical protein
MTRALVIGQSHSAAIAEALAGDCASVEGISIYRLGDQERPDANAVSLVEAVAIVAALPATIPVFLSILGSYHNILGLLRSGADFDFLVTTKDAPDPQAIARIPHRAIAAAFEQNFVAAESVRKIRDAARSPIYILSTPPPKESDEFVLARLMSQKKKSYRGKSIPEVGVERAGIRLKLWTLEASLTARWAELHNMHFVPAPAKSFNENGFLASEYYAEDATHANGRYGELVVEQIYSIMESTREQAAHG